MSRALEQAVELRTGEAQSPVPRCHNCGASAPDQFCPRCGQETRVSLPTLREFTREAMGRLVAFDGRLWRTLLSLAFRPGFLTRVYLSGARRRYVSPARLFLAMSLLLFAVIRFELGTPDLSKAIVVDDSRGERESASSDPASIAMESGTERFQIGLDENFNVVIRGVADRFLAKELRKRFDRFNRQSPAEKVQQIVDGALRYGSYVAFLLLPLFAALQLVSYVGSRLGRAERPRLYAEHLVYAAHLHAFGFMMVALALAVPYPPFRWLLVVWMLYYVMRAKQVVYGGRWRGRVIRSLAVFMVYAIALAAATVGLVAAAILWR
jgi:Protein of unknown function (DUF3667)